MSGSYSKASGGYDTGFATAATPGEHPQASLQGALEETLAYQRVEAGSQELSLNLEGDLQVTETAAIQYAFPRIARALHEVENLRPQRRVDGTLGDILPIHIARPPARLPL